MSFRYLAMLPVNLWLKAMLPVILLLVIFFLNSFVVDQIEQVFQTKARKTRDIFKVQLGGDNATFATALSKEKQLHYEDIIPYTDILKDGIIQRQKNNKIIYRENKVEVAEAGSSAIERAVRPPEPVYTVSSIFIGKIRKFAVINGKVFKVGDNIGNDETITDIKDGKVHVAGPWGVRWLFVNY